MLTLPRAAHILRLQARALSTVAHSAGSPGAGAEQFTSNPAPDKATTTGQTPVTSSGVECMFVSPWHGIRSSAEGLMIARAVQEKYGTAKEVVFPRDSDSVNLFQPYFWLVYDDPNVRKRLPEANEQITVQVEDLPRIDSNIGLEEMMRGMGISTSDGKDPRHESPPPTETEPSTNSASDPVPEGYKIVDVRVEWAFYGPNEVLRPRYRASVPIPDKMLPRFASTWLAFDGFSPESARGPHTPNLLHARNKWRKLAPSPPASALDEDNDNVATTAAAAASSSQGTVGAEVGTESTTETQGENLSSHEWVPIVPSSTPHAQRLRPSSAPPKYSNNKNTSATTAPDSPSPITTPTADTTGATPAPTLAGTKITRGAQPLSSKLTRRERILQLARQNARTPLPKLVETFQPPPPPPAEAEKLDEESERQGKERTIRERLWRLVGGNY